MMKFSERNLGTSARDAHYPKNTKQPSKRFRLSASLFVALCIGIGGTMLFSTKASAATDWFDYGWRYRKTITINHASVPNTDQSHFPVLISISDSDLRDHALHSGDDILFTDATGLAKIPYERESYASDTGALVAWVNVASLSHSADTVMYMYYGNSGASDQQDHAGGTWDANFQGVWHAQDASSNTIVDSTAHADTGIKYGLAGPVETTGKIGRAQSYNGNDDYIGIHPSGSLSGSFTVSAWASVLDENDRTVIGTRNDGDLSFDFKFQGQEFLHGDIGDGTDWITTNADAPFAYTFDTWHQLVYAVTSTGYAIYLDGSEAASGSYDASTPLLFDADHNLFVGQVGYDEEWFYGAIDEVRISDIARSPDWIKTEYNNQNHPSDFYYLGSEAIGDETAPSTPGLPTTASPTNTNMPTWSWTASTDTVSGLADPAYSVQWCRNADFTGCDANTSTSNAPSFTHSVPLADGTWYVRVNASDAAGNSSSYSSSGSVLIDTVAPSVPGLPVATVPKGVASTDLSSQDWIWTASTDTGSGMSHYLWWVNGGPNGTVTAATNTTDLSIGTWKFHVQAVDHAGNQSADHSSLLAIMASSMNAVTVDCSVPLIHTVASANDISNPILDLTPITTTNGIVTEADLSCSLFLKTLIPPYYIIVEIPSGAAIKGQSSLWSDKTIVPPIPITPLTTLLPAGSQVALAVVVGHPVAPLDITKGTRIFMSGQAGKRIGYISNNIFTEITSTCNNDSQITGDALSAEGSCKIDSGSDLVIWTKHFSQFVAYTVTPVSQDHSSRGGNGMPAEWYDPPKPPTGGFGLFINDGISSTTDPTVTLHLYGGPNTTRMAISPFPDFRDASQENYATTTTWNLCWKNPISQAPSTCPAGTYTLYAKFYSPWGTASDVVSNSIALKEPDRTVQPPTHSINVPVKNFPRRPFTVNLKPGQVSNDVKRLQIFLNQFPDTQIAKIGAGSPGKETRTYGPLTKAAVKKFQEKFAGEILMPMGLKKGTGVCAQSTRSKINTMLGL
ncbi:MAG: DUF2341 domain-containing protein [Patescibacteria group bacterium]